jgi:hypothetical protein
MEKKYKAGDRIISTGSGKSGTIAKYLGEIFPKTHSYWIVWDSGMQSARLESSLLHKEP